MAEAGKNAENLSGKRLLVLGGSRQAEEGLRQLKALGLEIVLCDFDEEAPGRVHASDFILGSVYHLDDCLPKIEHYHRKTAIDGVMCLACDVPHVVARIAAKLVLPGIPIEAADRAVDKLSMKKKFSEDGVAVPQFWQVETPDVLSGLLKRYSNLVVKPSDSRGSKGVSRLKSDGDAEWAFNYALNNSPSGTVMAEEYIFGPQISSESVVVSGQVVTPALSDRSYEFLKRFHPYIVENGGDMPTAQPAGVVKKINDLLNNAAESLGVANGIVKGDIVVCDGKPMIIELAARLSGGYFCTHQIPYSTGVHLVEACARIALGQALSPADWIAKTNKHVTTRWKIAEPGVVRDIPDPEKIRSLPGVLAFEHWLTEGQKIEPAKNAAASVAMIQATGATREDAIETAEYGLQLFNPISS